MKIKIFPLSSKISKKDLNYIADMMFNHFNVKVVIDYKRYNYPHKDGMLNAEKALYDLRYGSRYCKYGEWLLGITKKKLAYKHHEKSNLRTLGLSYPMRSIFWDSNGMAIASINKWDRDCMVKVCLHELGHSLGVIKHCKHKCVMRAIVSGKNSVERFCKTCANTIESNLKYLR